MKIQEILSLGYLYLIVVGIIGDVIRYKQIGVDILNYSTVWDVMLSPINYLTKDYRTLLIVLVFTAACYFYFVKIAPKLHLKYREKEWYKKTTNIEKMDEKYAKPDEGGIYILLMLVVFSMFVGMGVGNGGVLKRQLQNNELRMTHEIDFSNSETKEVRIIGLNSTYLFYAGYGDKEISIASINPNVKEIRRLTKLRRDEEKQKFK